MRRSLPALLLLALLCCLFPLYALAGSAGLSGTAWVDDGSGLYGAGSRPLAKVSVALYRLDDSGNESQVKRVSTDQDGAYSFSGLDAGTYRLRASLPAEYQFIAPKTGGSIMLPASGGDSFSMPIALTEGQQKTDMHIGASKGGCFIKAIVFEDLNQNGGRSVNETLLRGVEVTLLYEMDGELVEIASVRSDQDGDATFWKLTPGTYRLAAQLPAPYIIGPLGEKVSQWYNAIPPCDSSYGVSEPQTVARGSSLGMGVGAVSTGSVQGRLWYDENCNGKADSSEGGFAGASVHLFSADAGVDRTAETNAKGEYAFEGLLAGDYTLSITLPEGHMFTLPGGDSRLTAGYDLSDACPLAVEDSAVTEAPLIGVMPATSLAVQLYTDVNTNGMFDGDEPVFAGASLAVLTHDTVRATAVSDGSGVARIPVLRGGDMELRLMLPDGQVFTVDGEQNDFYAPAATSDLTLPLSLAHGEHVALYAGVTLPAAVSGTLFDDRNLSGVLDSEETGLADFTVQAVNAAGEVVAQTATDAEGGYSLNNLLPAPHTIRFLLTDAYVCTDPSDTGAPVENHVTAQTPEYGETPVLRLAPGQSLTNISGGIFRSATVSGQVLLSTGIASLPAEGGMEGVHVILLDEKGNAVSDTTEAYTDADGHFYLKGALPGTYMLEYRLPEHAAFTQPDTISPVIYSDPFTTGAADDLVQAPLYAIYTGCLGGRIYRDSSLNGAYDPEETALGGVPLQLENTDLGLVYETISHEDGTYLLDDLRPGAYALRVTLPEELCFAYDASSPIAARAVSGAEAALNIGIGDRLEQRNIAAAAPAQLNGSIYFDLENDGKRGENDPGAAGITLSLRSVNGAQSYSVQTDSSGRFALAALVPGNYTLRVTLDSDCIPADGNDAQLTDGFWTSSLVFADGESAAPEYGILRHARVAGHVWSLDGTLNGVTGRTVELFMEADNEPLGTAVTDENGAFSFDQLKPGQYKLRCDLPDERYDFARPVDAALRAGAKPDVPVGYYDYFQVSMGADMTACDIGIGAMGSLGDTAWLDLNGNGLQDAEEPNLPGVTIRLYQYGTLAAETVTDAYGHYLITDLYPGAYTVQVTPPVEVKPTLRRTDYPLAASVLTETEEATAEAEGITVPSAGRNLNCDFGFVPRQEGGVPASLQDTPATDWSFNGARK